MKKRIHGNGILEKKILDLYNEGWHLANIASIAHSDANTVREILNRNGILI